MHKSGLVLAAALLLGGCALFHSQTTPSVVAAEAWRTPADSGDADSVLARDFWLAYDDPALNTLMEEAFRANPEVRIAAANVQAYRARVTATGADRFPQVGLSAQAARGQRGDFPPDPANAFSAGVSLSWEVDLWGRLARATDAARADLLAQQAVQRGVWLSLAASVAQGYFTLLQLDAQRDISRRTLALRKQSLDLFQLRFEGGVVSEVELAQVRSEYEQAVAAVPQIEAAIARGENALSALLGRNPGPIARGRTLEALRDPQVPAGLPSQLLARRPDVRAAEAQLAAADARVDAARLAWFPRINLTGLFGVASNDLSSLFDSGTTVWSGVAGLTQPVFDAGRIGAGVDSARASREAVVAQYQKTVQNAFREVDDALVSRVKLQEQLAASARQVQALARYAELARLRYENGYTSYLEVIDADRALFSADLNRAATQSAVLAASVDLYRALGGSWMDGRIAHGG